MNRNGNAMTNIFLFLLLLGLMSQPSLVIAQSQGRFTATGNMNIAHGTVIGTLLPGGEVLILGLDGGSVELYDPTSGTFTSAALPMHWSGPVTLLGDGRFFMIGNDGTMNVAYLYDPTSQTITQTGSSVTNQLGGGATLLRNGKILIAGGVTGRPVDGVETIATPEVYDPSTGTFTATGAFVTKSSVFFIGGPTLAAVSLLPDGRVLFAGEPNSEVYDPVTGRFSLTGSMTTSCFGNDTTDKPDYIGGRTATLLQNGRVLLTGGEHEDCGRFANAELYDPATGQFTPTGNMTRARSNHTATLLPDGTVLIAGGETQDCDGVGCSFSGTTAAAESYDPSTGTFATVGDMTASRAGQMATLLQNGTVLIAGGYAYGETGAESKPCLVCVSYLGTLSSAEIYTPPVSVPVLAVTDLQLNRTTVTAGVPYSVNISGSNLDTQTFFDVRFRVPGSTLDQDALNWQRGTSGSHAVSPGTATGIWTVTGVRPHQLEADHTGGFVPVSATITVSP